jgi:hypothetical protein
MEGSVLCADYPVQVELGLRYRFFKMNERYVSEPRDVGLLRIGLSHTTSWLGALASWRSVALCREVEATWISSRQGLVRFTS